MWKTEAKIKGIIFFTVISSAVFLPRMGLTAQERDPFISVLDLEKQKVRIQINRNMDLSQFALKGILWNESVSVAIINDELYMAGDDCKGLKIKGIEKDGVTLTDGADSFKVTMKEDIAVSKKASLAQESGGNPSENTVNQEGGAPSQERIRGFLRSGPRQAQIPGRESSY